MKRNIFPTETVVTKTMEVKSDTKSRIMELAVAAALEVTVHIIKSKIK